MGESATARIVLGPKPVVHQESKASFSLVSLAGGTENGRSSLPESAHEMAHAIAADRPGPSERGRTRPGPERRPGEETRRQAGTEGARAGQAHRGGPAHPP